MERREAKKCVEKTRAWGCFLGTHSITSSQPIVVPMEFPQSEVKDVQRGQMSQLQLHYVGKMLLPFLFALWLCSKPRSQQERWDWPGAVRSHKG